MSAHAQLQNDNTAAFPRVDGRAATPGAQLVCKHAPMTPDAFIPETAPFDASQRLWLNGYVAGLLAGKGYALTAAGGATNGAINGATKATVPLLILFGSQTGTAQNLARRIAKEAGPRGFNARVIDAAEHAKIDWQSETSLLVISSTYGDGDMPDNAQSFWEWLGSDGAKAVSHLNFSVLALGDTNYAEFCAAGKKIDARLEGLGAKRVYPRTDCDVDYEAKAMEWIGGVLSILAPAQNGSAPVGQSPQIALQTVVNGWTKTNPFPAQLLTNRRLNGEGSQKETRHFEISLEGSGLNYEAGDALGVWPANCPELVMDILRAIDSKGDEMVKVSSGEFPLRQALLEKLDISKPGLELLRHFARTDPVLQQLLAPERKDDLRKWLWGRGIIDLLTDNSTIKLSAAEFVALLKPISPRLYSISSSPKAHAGEVHLTINVVRYDAHGRPRKGIASTFLAVRAAQETPVPVFVQTSHGFRLPANGETPVVMVGPGTGVAPFRAFLHERRETGSKGRNWLFFGEQRAATDFYYRDELETMLADGQLTKLSTAFSRDQPEKIYVQNRMLENASLLWSWLEDGAHFYVCGDASRMAKDVDDALHRIVETTGGKSADDAKAYVANLKSDKRYQRDVY
jgi:sulfite reductase (NADPH) flavoprotein alpha-component